MIAGARVRDYRRCSREFISYRIDTAPLIYFVENHPIFSPIVTEIFSRIDSGAMSGIVSVLTITETLVHPKRNGNRVLEAQYRDILLNSRNIVSYAINVDIADRAAGLRAQYGLRTPDAIQIATALAAGCDTFLTNDNDLTRVVELKVLIVSSITL